MWCQRAVRAAWLCHHSIPHSTGESMLSPLSCSASEKILPFLSPGHQVNYTKLIHPPPIWVSRDLNGSNWLSLNLCFLISGRYVTWIWQFSSTSTSTFSNSSISYLKSEYKNLHTGTVPRLSQRDMMNNLHIDPEDVLICSWLYWLWYRNRDKQVLNWDEFTSILYWTDICFSFQHYYKN